MSRIEYTPIEVRESRDPARPNAIYTAIEAADSVTADNLGEEGLDRRPFVAFPQGEIVAKVSPGARAGASLGITGAWTTLAHNAVNMETGAITLEDGDKLDIRAHVFLQNTFANGLGLTPGSIFQLRIAYDAGAGVVGITHSERPWSVNAAAASSAHANTETVARLVGPLSLNFVRLQYQLDAGVAFPWAPLLICTRYRRVS